jgi:threonylcarbamoyladenosine tRNA methylthiotransferase MtaB
MSNNPGKARKGIMRVALLSLGCKVNQAEITRMEKTLQGWGHGVVGLGDRPEVCIINTCTVTSRSDYQSRQLIRRARKAGARVLVTGCYAQLNKQYVESMDGVEAVVDNSNKHNIINIINGNGECNTSNKEAHRTRYFLKVQDGCDYSCSYCIITKARGPSRSVRCDEVVSLVKDAVSEGYREVVLSGVHLGLYGLDLEPKMSLAHLVENILEKTDTYRIRLSSLQVNEIDNRLLELMEESRLCRHLHVPLQSGDNRVLGLMGRNYDANSFRRKIEKIHETMGTIAIGTDIIAGFPQEEEAEFQNSYRLAEELPFAYMHVFPYSPRPGTAAAEMVDIVGHRRRKERASALRALAERKRSDYMKRHVGETLDVLMEERDGKHTWRGTSSNYLKVRVSGLRKSRGNVVPVRIEGMDKDVLTGKPLIHP